MSRREHISEAVKGNEQVQPLIDELLYLEGVLNELRLLPKIKVNPKNPTQQKATPAAKLYKEYLQQYINVQKVLLKMAGNDMADDDNPLVEWFRAHGVKE